jgi:hypothetical protein
MNAPCHFKTFSNFKFRSPSLTQNRFNDIFKPEFHILAINTAIQARETANTAFFSLLYDSEKYFSDLWELRGLSTTNSKKTVNYTDLKNV